MIKPNLFSYATSELSQDAFLCWFIAWADPTCEKLDTSLHHAAVRFLKLMFSKHGIDMPLIKSLQIKRQVDNMDVFVVMNETYALIIEDKTYTNEHSNQLTKYRITTEQKEIYKNILPIYYKTGNQSDYTKVYDAGYQVIKRSEMIQLLEKGLNKIRSDIYNDYYRHLMHLEKRYQRFRSLPMDQWDHYSWHGFYTELQKHFAGNWGFVSNPRGGFEGFWWNFRRLENCRLHLQLEQDKLCIKIHVPTKQDQSRLRNKWYKKIMKEASHYELNITKPARFRAGNTMTTAVFGDDYRKSNDGLIDLNETIKLLKKAEHFLNSLIQTSGENIKT